MRAIIIGSELINLATAYNLSHMGFEVTVIESISQQTSAKESVETHLFKQQLENNAREAGVRFRAGCVAQKFITQHKQVSGVVIRNELNQMETLMADRVVAALNAQNGALLKAAGVDSPSNIKAFNLEQYCNPLVGRSRYSNLFVNVGYSSVSTSVVSQSASLLANFVHNPSLDEVKSASFMESIQAGLSTFFTSFFGASGSVPA